MFRVNYLASEDQKKTIKELFQLLYDNINENLKEDDKKKIFSKTLYGINDSRIIEQWVQSNLDELSSITDGIDFIEKVWELFLKHSSNKNIQKFNNQRILKEIAKKWVSGESFDTLLKIAQKNNCKLGKGSRNVTVDNIVDISEGGISYDGSLLVGAIREFASLHEHDNKDETLELLNLIQKQFKYGLPTEQSILLYEIGFSDRVIAQEIASTLIFTSTQKKQAIKEIKRHKELVANILNQYPNYFQSILIKIIS